LCYCRGVQMCQNPGDNALCSTVVQIHVLRKNLEGSKI
jgi:hypothetical protein